MVCVYLSFKSSRLLTYLPHSLDELVKDGKNGLIFQNASQLAEQFEVGLRADFTSLSVDLMSSLGTSHSVPFFAQTIIFNRFFEKCITST